MTEEKECHPERSEESITATFLGLRSQNESGNYGFFGRQRLPLNDERGGGGRPKTRGLTLSQNIFTLTGKHSFKRGCEYL